MCRLLQGKDALVDILVSVDAHFRKSEKTICFRQAINNMIDYHILYSVLFVASLFDEYSLS